MPCCERELGRGLPARVDRQRDIVADRPGIDVQWRADGLPGRVDFDLLASRLAAQVLLERALGTVLADRLALLVTVVAARRELFVGDLADVAEDVRGELALRVVPDRQLLHLGARIVLDVFEDRDTRRFPGSLPPRSRV